MAQARKKRGATAKRAASRRTISGARRANGKGRTQDAIAVLKADHKEVKGWFKQYEKLDDDGEKGELAQRICQALTVHTQIEEEIFYPEVREETEEDELLDEAKVEHMSAKQLIAEIESMEPGEELYDAKVKVLGEYVNHHVEEEEGELFPKVRKSDLDLKEIGERLKARKDELMAGG
jgi:hemerythrin superfamily protein